MARHGSAATGTQEPTAEPAPSRGMSGWPIRRKLVALVAGPLVVLLAAGTFITAQTITQLRDAQRAQALASAARDMNTLAARLQNELADTIVGAPRTGDKENKFTPAVRQAIRQDRVLTDRAMQAALRSLNDAPAGGWGPRVEATLGDLRRLPGILADHRLRSVPPRAGAGLGSSVILQGYGLFLSQTRVLIADLAGELVTATTEGSTVDAALTLAAASSTSAAAAQEIVDVYDAITTSKYTAAEGQGLTELKIQQLDQLEIASRFATPDQRAAIEAIRLDEERINDFRISALRLTAQVQEDGTLSREPLDQLKVKARLDKEASDFYGVASSRLTNLDRLVDRIAAATAEGASAQARSALVRSIVAAALALATLLLVTAFAAAIARTVSAPMRRLRAGAVEAATVRLPAAVRQIEREGPDAVVTMPPVLPPDSRVGPETVEVARAVDGLANEAVRLAASQVRLRQALDEAFVSMSRRSQSMVEKQLSIIDELESTEEDPDQLRNLFRLDHLAARMRRYNDNLLVLAGSAVRTRSTAPVPIADVFRAATSEMEQYERVRLQPVGGAAVSGPAAGGLIHLLAELLDNAAMYSPPTSPILMSAIFTPDGGLQLEITDSGVGIPPSELADLNSRLALPGSIDMQVPSRMGLYVVARLAQRGGFTVRLAPRPHVAGTVAEVLVPAALVVGAPGGTPSAGRPGRGPERAPGTPESGSSLAAALSAGTETSRPGALPLQTSNGSNGSDGRRSTSPAAAPAFGGSSLPASPAPASPLPVAAAGGAAAAGAGALGAAAAGRTGGLPSRRPGAALSGGPLAGAGAPLASGGLSPFDRPALAPSAATAPGGSPAGGATAAWRPRVAPDAVPAAAPDPLRDPLPPEPEAAAPSAAPSAAPAPAPASGPATGEHVPFGVSASSPSPFATPGGAGMPAAARRPAAGPGGASAATAAAAAAAARRGLGTGPTPAAGLFTARGPAGPPVNSAPGSTDTGPTRPVAVRAAEPALAPSPSPVEAPVEPAPVEPADLPVAVAPAEPPATDDGPLHDTGSVAAVAGGAAAPAAWNGALPAELAARVSSGRQAPAGRPSAQEPARPALPEATTPIFDTVSVWFTGESPAVGAGRGDRVIDLRDGARPSASGSGRWSALGDQRWQATNARAAASPEVAGTTEVGLPRRRPGANLLPSAVTAAAAGAPTGPSGRSDQPRPEPDAVRGRLGGYQRGLSSARRARHLPAGRAEDHVFDTSGTNGDPAGHRPADQGGDS